MLQTPVIVLLGFILLHPILGLFHNKYKNINGFVLAGREVGPWLAATSILASVLGASAVLGTSGLASSAGWSTLVWLGSGSLGLMVLGALLPKVSFQGARSLPELLGARGSRTLRIASALVIVPAWIGIIAAQLSAVARISDSLSPGLGTVGAVVGAGVVIFYVASAGQQGVMKTDRIQLLATLALLGGLAVALALGSYPSAAPSTPLPGLKLLDIGLAVSLPFLIGPDIFSRLLTVSSLRNQQKAAWIAGLVLLVVAVLITWIGTAGSGIVGPGKGEFLLSLIAALASPLVAAFAAAALLAVVLSSADTCLMSAATILSLDLLGRESIRAIRVATVCLGLLSLGLALWSPGIIPNLMLAYTLFTAGLGLPGVLTLFTRWRGGPGLMAAVTLTGAGIGLAANFLGLPLGLPAAILTQALIIGAALVFSRLRARTVV